MPLGVLVSASPPDAMAVQVAPRLDSYVPTAPETTQECGDWRGWDLPLLELGDLQSCGRSWCYHWQPKLPNGATTLIRICPGLWQSRCFVGVGHPTQVTQQL